jgi:hypothetical protein
MGSRGTTQALGSGRRRQGSGERCLGTFWPPVPSNAWGDVFPLPRLGHQDAVDTWSGMCYTLAVAWGCLLVQRGLAVGWARSEHHASIDQRGYNL